ncbi:MAG: SOS response-associated peptidase [Taibaiella sp.]|nr:SOS response-associated peptidase [Taibaiella sp.]
MCYYLKVAATAKKLAEQYNKEINVDFTPGDFNGFEHPLTPVIANAQPEAIQLAQWGLVPHWADRSFEARNTLNARIETLTDKASFSPYLSNRCLVLVSGFYEWQWLDKQGKRKQKYYITGASETFALAGLWSVYDRQLTYSIVTTAANPQMAVIHNSKERMPVVLSGTQEADWLACAPVATFRDCQALLYPQAVLEAGTNQQLSLF